MEYLIKVSIIMVLFYLCYKLFLNRETFFESNRSFLFIGLLTAFILPLVVIPKYVVLETQNVLSSDSYIDTVSQSPFSDNSISLTSILMYVYLIGIVFFSIRFLIQFSSLLSLYFNSTRKRVSSFIYIITKKALSPFSFFNWIVFNPEQFNELELKQIINHEKVHAKQLHSIDILLVELSSIILWFNPLVWLYKKDLRQNLEFIADKNAQAITNCKKSYQHLLLKTSVPNYNLALTNNFYNSLIKKRIVMLHKNKSKNRNQLKFLLILPALAIFLMSFNTKEIYIERALENNKATSDVLDLNSFESSPFETYEIAENIIPKATKTTATKVDIQKPISTIAQDIVTYFIESNFTDEQLDNIVTKLKAQGITLKIKNVKRNSDNKITAIKIDAKSKNSNANFSLNNDTAIKTVRITYNAKDDSISIGNTNHLIHDKDYEYIHNDGVVKISKNGNSDNVFVFSSDDDHDHDSNISADTIHFKGNVHIKDKNVFVIKDGDKVIDLKGNVVKKGNYIIVKDKKGKTIKEWKDKDGNIFIHEDEDHDDDNGGLFISKDGDKNVKITLSGTSSTTDGKDEKIIIKSSSGKSLWVSDKNKGKSKIFLSSDSDKEPLFIVDGKEVAKKDSDIDPNNIESINVLKGEAAIKKYGKKGKNGIVEIITKNKKD